MNIFNKAILKQTITKELKYLKNKSNFACANTMITKSFSSGVFCKNVAISSKTFSQNMSQSVNSGFYFVKRNTFADSNILFKKYLLNSSYLRTSPTY